MLSFRGRLFRFMLKYNHLFRIQLRKKLFDPSPEGIKRLRERTENAGKMLGKMPKGIEVSSVSIDNIYAEWIQPAKAKKIYFISKS